MYWINLLHIYQPSNQYKKILETVSNESYRLLFRGLLKIPDLKINLNINGGLTELFAKNGYEDIIYNIRKLAAEGKLEFTESAKYHPLLPFLEEKEIIEQIRENYKTNRKYFGRFYHPVAFFPPEMAYSRKVGEVVSKLGYKIILLDEIAYNGGKNEPAKDKLFPVRGTNLIALFRERRVSNAVMSALIHTKKEFKEILADDLRKNIYLFTAMDGETFGHHRPGLEKVLFKLLSLSKPKQLFVSEAVKYFPLDNKKISPIESTWASSKEDIDKNIQFYSWKDPKNKVHQLQWRFFNFLLKLSRGKSLNPFTKNLLCQSMSSDQFFWASGEPWWSIEMIEKGAWLMLSALNHLPSLSKSKKKKGEEYYKNILATAFFWQRSGKIERKAQLFEEERRIPFRERTLEKGKPEVYYAFLETMRKKMWKAAKEKNFERAILWRDAIWKLETKNDIYDIIRAIDLLRLEVPDKKLRRIMDRYKKKYKKIMPGQPELRKIND